jgi:hypothetical protein
MSWDVDANMDAIWLIVTTPLWGECEDETHTPEMGTWVSVGTPETSKFDCRGQNTSHCGVLYIIGKLLKRRCRKWALVSWSGVPGACRWSATHCWKALDESYKFASNLIPIGGLGKKLWFRKVAKMQIETVLGFLLGSPGIKNHLDASAMERRREYYMGEGGGFPWVQAMVSLVSPELPMVCLSTKGASESELTNLLVG